WSAVANVQFVQTKDADSAELTFHRGSDNSAFEQDIELDGPVGAGAVGSSVLLTREKAEISIDTSVPGFGPMDGKFTTIGGYVWETIIHELGHSLGLGHAGPYNGNVNPMTQ